MAKKTKSSSDTGVYRVTEIIGTFVLVFAILAITPIVLTPFAFVLEGERPTIRWLVGGAIAVGGIIAWALSR